MALAIKFIALLASAFLAIGAQGARITRAQRHPTSSSAHRPAERPVRKMELPLASVITGPAKQLSPKMDLPLSSVRTVAAVRSSLGANLNVTSHASSSGEHSLAGVSSHARAPAAAAAKAAGSTAAQVGAIGDTRAQSGSRHTPPPHHFDGADVVHGRKPHAQGVQVPPAAYLAALVLLAGVVVIIYGPRGPRVVLSVLVYLGALSTMTLSVKWVFSTYEYVFPNTVTALHFLSGGVVTGTLLVARRRQGGRPVPVPTAYEFGLLVFPIAIAVVASIGTNNMALVHSSAAFTEIIGSSTCLFTIAMVVIMGMPFDKWLVLPALLVAAGCALSITGEVNFSAVGMLLCFTANGFRSLKASLQQKLMTGETRDKFDPCTLLFWICLPSAAVIILVSLATEGLEPYRALATMEAQKLHGLVLALAGSCVNATILNLAQLFVTKELGAVGSQLAAQAKSVLVVMGSMVLFADPLMLQQVVGFMQVLVGVFIFSRMEQPSHKAAEGEKSGPAAIRAGGH